MNLETLHIPRSSTSDTFSSRHHSFNQTDITAPLPRLSNLHISGGLKDTSLTDFKPVIDTLTHLTISNSTNLTEESIFSFLTHISETPANRLTYLKITYQMPRLNHHALDWILDVLPNLHHLFIATDFISSEFASSRIVVVLDDDLHQQQNTPPTSTTPSQKRRSHPCSLQTLELDKWQAESKSTAPGRLPPWQPQQPSFRLTANDLFTAVAEGYLSNLRTVKVSDRLGWGAAADSSSSSSSQQRHEDMQDLHELLETLDREDVEEKGLEGVGDAAGLWVVH